MVKGKVVSGLDRGAYYMKQPEYKKQINETLGFVPYPGTLNIKLEKDYEFRKKRYFIEGFTKNGESFADCEVFKVMLNKINCAIIVPKITDHPKDVAEIISPEYLRGVLNLQDGDEVEII